jgi:hypothetical protein
MRSMSSPPTVCSFVNSESHRCKINPLFELIRSLDAHPCKAGGEVPKEDRGPDGPNPDATAAQERLRHVRSKARPPRRPGDGQVFVYAGRRLGPFWLSDVDLQTVAVAAGGLMVELGEAKLAVAINRLGADLPVILDPAWFMNPASSEPSTQPSLWSTDPLSVLVEGQAQHRVAAYLSPAKCIGPREHQGLRRALDDGMRFAELASQLSHRAPVLTALPISPAWLSHPRDREQLIKAVLRASIGVALFPCGSGDPLGGRRAVAGLVEVLQAVPHDVAVLRTDLAGIGGLAFGAAATSIGLSPSLRHTVQTGSRPYAQPDRSPRVLVERLLTWTRGSQLAQITRDGGLLDCECPVCHGRSLRRFIREDAETAAEAAAHSVLTWRAITDRVLGQPTRRQRRMAWLQACADAIDEHAALRDRSRIALRLPDYLNSWTALLV